jgi:hypothetical protein
MKNFLIVLFIFTLPLLLQADFRPGGSAGTAVTLDSLDGANETLSNLTTTAVNAAINPGANGTIDLGTTTGPFAFRDAFLTSGIKKSNAVLVLDLANSRLNDASGNPSIYIDSKLLRTGTHGAPVTKLGWTNNVQVGAVGLTPNSVTADPCASATNYPEGSMFYNNTSDYMCFCGPANADLQVHSPATPCF